MSVFKIGMFFMTRFFLDICSINALSGLDSISFAHLRSLLEESDSELCASHIQVDERYTKNNPNFQQLCEKAFKAFEEHGIKISLGVTKGGFYDISKYDECTYIGEDLAGIYDELGDELKKCMKEKGKYYSKPFDEKAMINNIRDCLIAITSTDYDYFMTSDCCLCESFSKILHKNDAKLILGRTLEIIYVKPHPQKIHQKLFSVFEAQKT